MFKRVSISIIGALAVTFLLFWGMDYLIAPEDAAKPEIKNHGPIEIGEVKEATDVRPEIDKPAEPENTPPPAIDDWPETEPEDGGPIVIGINIPPPPDGGAQGGFRRFGLPEGDVQAITKFAPRYPSGPLSRGTEGYVVVSFTVNKLGAVENVIIVESSHSGFNKAAISAVLKFKYKPRVMDGRAVPAPGIMEKISFVIEKS